MWLGQGEKKMVYLWQLLMYIFSSSLFPFSLLVFSTYDCLILVLILFLIILVNIFNYHIQGCISVFPCGSARKRIHLQCGRPGFDSLTRLKGLSIYAQSKQPEAHSGEITFFIPKQPCPLPLTVPECILLLGKGPNPSPSLTNSSMSG